MFDRDAMAQAIYERVYEGYYVTPWAELTSDRRWRFLNAADDAIVRMLRDLDKPRARVVTVATRKERVA